MRSAGILRGMVAATLVAGAAAGFAAEKSILVYTKNGKGFVHDNIAASVVAIKKIGEKNGWKVDVSDQPTVFTEGNLKQYQAIVFDNSNNEAFDTEEQKAAFQGYIHAGGGFAGIHSATGSERKWPWYWKLIGGTFAWHHPLQPFTIVIVDKKHPSTAFFPADTWKWEDEFYMVKERDENVRVLLAGDTATILKPGKKSEALQDLKTPNPYPLCWCHEFEGGRAWYTALGHKSQYYSDPLFVQHLEGGIKWAMGEAK